MLNLQEKKHRFTPPMLALAQQPPSFEEIFQTLLKGKPDLNVQESSGQTVMHLATVLPIYILCLTCFYATNVAAIAHSKKRVVKNSKETTGIARYWWVAMVFAIIAVLIALFSA
ncbi:hypothetical protein PsorP6_010082 [Peronosclerospora sorghi]|uniref:Uncharacterized protein n=1 Tax=Peronosclerospora sorghi TaxID=230839 RepID=A0ACC0VWM3_9STRA|nr:hypothetical protein PsorP6_010082 [Peronosclerospora sorghi]